MSPVGDGADQTGKALRHPAQDEERGLETVLVQKIQHARGIVLDPGRIDVPVLRIDDLGKGRDLEIVFHVYR